MKFEFNMALKAVPSANVTCAFECNADELSLMLADPVYQELGAKLIREVSFAPKAQPKQEVDADRNGAQQAKSADTISELCNKVNAMLASLKKEREANAKCRQQDLHIAEKLYRRMEDMAERNSKFQ